MTNLVKGKTQKQFLENKLTQLLYIYGISGQEERVQKYLLRELSELNSEFVKQDKYGNIHAMFKVGTGVGATLHLNSHMDTVRDVKEDKYIRNDNGVFTAVLPDGTRGILGADDRAGIAIILTILNFPPKFDGMIKVSFYREEEIGCVGSSNSDLGFLEDVDFSMTFDRHGSSDIVAGTWGRPFCCNEVGNWLEGLAKKENYKFKMVEGGLSDAYTVSENGINAINLSVGYYNEHTAREYLVFKELYTSLEFAKLAISDLNRVYDDFSGVPFESKWIKEGSYNNFGCDYESDCADKVVSDEGFYAPVAYLCEDYGIVTDGAYEMTMTYDEVCDLLKQLNGVKEAMEGATQYKNMI